MVFYDLYFINLKVFKRIFWKGIVWNVFEKVVIMVKNISFCFKL